MFNHETKNAIWAIAITLAKGCAGNHSFQNSNQLLISNKTSTCYTAPDAYDCYAGESAEAIKDDLLSYRTQKLQSIKSNSKMFALEVIGHFVCQWLVYICELLHSLLLKNAYNNWF